MISVDEAQARCLALCPPLPSEMVSLRAGLGRHMAAPATARITQPPFDAAAMDGYALTGPAPLGARFAIMGEAAAGRAMAGALQTGQAARIFTGAPLPDGAGAIVMQEDALAEDGHITLTAAAAARAHIRPRGQDFAAGDLLAPRLLTPSTLALLAAMNVPEVAVHRRPVVAILATGDELVMPGEVPRADQIIASNGFAIAAMVESAGGRARMLPIARDNRESLTEGFDLAAGADIIVTIGGASVGDHDLVGRVAGELGLDLAFWRIAMRPGKPLMAGRLRGAVLLGLPGNPVSSIVCAHLFLLPMLRALQGHSAAVPTPLQAHLAAPLPANGPRAHYMRAELAGGILTPFPTQDSALLRVLSQSNALLIHPAHGAARSAGDVVDYLPI